MFVIFLHVFEFIVLFNVLLLSAASDPTYQELGQAA